MNDDLSDLKAMMDEATPRPDAARRAENLALAQKNFEDLQGSRVQPRPTPATEAKGLWTGVTNMLTSFTSKAALTTTTAIVACGFLFLTPQGQDLLSPPNGSDLTISEFEGRTSQPATENRIVPSDEAAPSLAEQSEEPKPTADNEDNQPQADVTPPVVNAPLRNPVGNVPGPLDHGTDAAEKQADTAEPSRESEVAPDQPAELTTQEFVLTLEAGQDRGISLDLEPPSEVVTEPPLGAVTANDAQTANVAPSVSTLSQETLDFEQQSARSTGVQRIIIPSPDNAVVTPPVDTEAFPTEAPNNLKITSEEPVSTFSIDVDTAAYGVVRSSLSRGQLPPAQAVRVEELINYFPYDYAAPEADEAPFRPTVNTFQTPWNADTQLVHIALQGEMPALDDRPPLNLVFLIDTSGSMNDPPSCPFSNNPSG